MGESGKTIVLYILIFVILDTTRENKYSELNGSKHVPNLICSSFMRFDVLTAVKISMLVFWVVTLPGFRPEDAGSMFLQNVGIYLQTYTALLHRGLTLTRS
jgi:hypothetical protein